MQSFTNKSSRNSYESEQLVRADSPAQMKLRISINSSRIRMLSDTWMKRWGRAPSDQELQNLVDNWIRDEILYLEALDRGLDRNDEIVRRRLTQKMRNLAFRLAWTMPPSEEELAEYHGRKGERYRQPARRSFSHIFFSREQRGRRVEQDARDSLVALLDQGGSKGLGDRFMLPNYFSNLMHSEVRNDFGSEFASSIFKLELGEWLGPISSSYGMHLVYIHEEVAAQDPALVEIEDQVKLDLNEERQREAAERLYQSFREKYEVIFDLEDEKDYEREIDELAATFFKGEANEEENTAKLKEIYDKVNVMLPPRYRGRVDNVSAAPMASADLLFDEDGNVAWDQIWGRDDPNQPFCELAIAGGPPHRGTLLEPVTPEEAISDLDQYAYVLQELARGLTMVTGRSVKMSSTPGWIGLQCDNEDMAIWILRGVIVENVMVRREDSVLYLPASPKYRLHYEIKNVVTACAKTFHYWNEHVAALQDHKEG